MLKLSLDTGRWYSLSRMTVPRRQHACTKVTLNGRPGLVVSGGMMTRREANMTSVEFYDVTSGQWVSLPSLNMGRRGHVMMVEKGRLVVVGGMQGSDEKYYLQDMEIFNGERWIQSEKKLKTGRQGFSMVKIPAAKLVRKLRRIPRRKKLLKL